MRETGGTWWKSKKRSDKWKKGRNKENKDGDIIEEERTKMVILSAEEKGNYSKGWGRDIKGRERRK